MENKQKGERIRASNWWWACTVAGFLLGIVSAVVGVIIEIDHRDTIGLIMIIFSPVLLGASGIFATLGAKYESEELNSKGH